VNGVAEAGAQEGGKGIARLCRHAGMSRQNYDAARRLRQRRQVDEALIVELVKRERQMQPRLGGRKLLHLLEPDLEEAQVEIGRDRFFVLLAEKDLLVLPKVGRPRTTNSRHALPVFHNLMAGKRFTGPDQAWVSDLTYIRTDVGFLYAALITDMYSRKIVGAHIGNSLEAEGCLRALDQALSQLAPGKRPIHHSDRGCQYCCHAYVERLQERELSISMTEVMHCYENAMAERMNGILKTNRQRQHGVRARFEPLTVFGESERLETEG
jgi:putative transposase